MEGEKFLFLDGRESKIALTFKKKKYYIQFQVVSWDTSYRFPM